MVNFNKNSSPQNLTSIQGSKQIISKDPQTVIIPINLRDVYARVQKHIINNWHGFSNVSNFTQEAAYNTVYNLPSGSKHFIQASDAYGYISKYHSYNCDQIVNIIIPNLRNIYYNNRKKLSESEQDLLEFSMKEDLPQFYNIYEYKLLSNLKYDQDLNIRKEYQLFGTITPYDVINVPLVNFINFINNGTPIQVQLYPLNIIISLTYETYDFWDFTTQKLISPVILSDICY